MRKVMDELAKQQKEFVAGAEALPWPRPKGGRCGVHIRHWHDDGAKGITLEADPGYMGLGVGMYPDEAERLGRALIAAAEVLRKEIDMKHGYNGPTIDHSLLSPSGEMSKRAREAALERERTKLFPPGTFDRPEPSTQEQREQKLRAAQNLRDLAARGMSPRKHIRAAERLEQEAETIKEKA